MFKNLSGKIPMKLKPDKVRIDYKVSLLHNSNGI